MKFIAFTGLGHHLARMLPVFDRLKELGHEITLLTTQNPWCCPRSDFEPPARRSELPYRLLSSTRRSPRFHEARNSLAGRLAKGLSLGFAAGETPPFFVREWHLAHSIWENIEDQAAFGVLIDELEPDAALVLHECNFWTRTLGAACHERHVPLFSFQEGTFYEIFPDALLREQGTFSTRVFVWGEHDRQRLIDAGVDPAKLRVSGPPHLDQARREFRRREAIRAEHGLKPDEKLVLFLAPNLSVAPIPASFSSSLLNEVAKRPKMRLFAKWRPVESGAGRQAFDRDARKVLKERFQSLDVADPYRLIAAADVTLGLGTTLGAEAVALGAPFLEVAWDGESDPVIGLASRAGVEVLSDPSSFERLAVYASQAVPVPVLQTCADFRRQFFAGLDGLATTRCCEGILEALRGPPPRLWTPTSSGPKT